MKHILCVIGQLGNGGSEKQLYLFLKYLDKAKYCASVFVTGSDKGIWGDRIRKDLNVDITSAGQGFFFSKVVLYRKELQKRKPDVIFSWSFFTNSLAWISGGTRFVGSMRNQYSNERKDIGGIRCWLSLKTKHIIVNSNFILDELIELGIKSNQFRVVFNIFESVIRIKEDQERIFIRDARKKFCEQYGIPLNTIIVMGIGRDTPQKNFAFFRDVVAKANSIDSRIHGVLVGSGGDAIRESIDSMGLQGIFTITGEVPFATEYLPFTDIFFLSSMREGMPNVLIEAIDAGCATLATDVGGVKDIFSKVPNHLLEKILVEEFNVQKAADMLLKLAADPDLRAETAKFNVRFLPELAPEKIMNQYYEVLGL